MSSFIEDFLYSATSGPGLIHIHHDEESIDVTGILASEVSISASTNYGSLIPDISTLTDLASIAGFASLPVWVGASSLMWRGTAPITFGADMYLVNYEPDLLHEENLKKLTKLCTLYESDLADFRSKFTAKVHGGYSTDAFASNQDFQAGNTMWSQVATAMSTVSGDGQKEEDSETRKNKQNAFNNIFSDVNAGTQITGTLTVAIGSKFRLRNLLLTKIDVTPSLVEVSADGSDPKPLYYRVGMSFTTCRCALEGDVDGMF